MFTAYELMRIRFDHASEGSPPTFPHSSCLAEGVRVFAISIVIRSFSNRRDGSSRFSFASRFSTEDEGGMTAVI
jgi:hypothetical protein